MKKALYLFFVCLASTAAAQTANSGAAGKYPPVVNFTAEQDRQNMMKQLGIEALRPGPSGDESAPNHANYDEALANPYPNYPEVLTLKNGKKVTTPALWWNQRRPEIAEDFEREVYGRVPKKVPKVIWQVTVTDKEMVGRTPVIAKQLVGRVDNSEYPLIDVNISMTLVTPTNVKGPVPVLMMFGRSGLPAPAQPPKEDLEKINAALKEILIKSDPSLKAIFEQYPAYNPFSPQATNPFGAFPAPGTPPSDPPTINQLVAAGWGYVTIDPTSIQADNGASLTKGIIGLVNKGQPRKPEDWGALRAWAWGASRALDYLEIEPTVDAKKVGIEGVSRYGKAALVTLAYDPRFALGLIGSAGQGGTKPNRRNFGEAVENLTGGLYYWMAGNYLKYGAAKASFGIKTANDLPVDQHELIAMCAPRPTFISYGIPEKGDAKWLDQQGSYMATVAAGPVYKLLGARDLGVTESYKTAKMPGVNISLLDGELAWRQHDGGHTDAPNIKYFIPWANKMVKYTPAPVTPTP
ncbi:alpha/beta hydrolase family protein [Adhaeribacter radiodurans]|uniref:Acetylxylan esterase n=1 Tax=Adhaeribacter radiodurans TaxID=2745197 RepID=A0A7L7LB13_9BACT|nr:acetylxylan esterase [Adhaeribacter radiodurans]QMU30010.1 acetylxylan esterase [Adhaeribacter radiodurans]